MSSRIEIEELIAEDDKVMSRVRMHSVQKGESGEMTSDNTEIDFKIFTVFRLDHGKIAEEWEIFDELGMMQQMGMELQMKDKIT
jgi:predicted ester cyclase